MAELVENINQDIDFDGLKLRAVSKAQSLKLFEDFAPDFPEESHGTNLVAISNLKHFTVVGFDKTFVIAGTDEFQKSAKAPEESCDFLRIQVETPIREILLSSCQTTAIIVCEDLSVLSYDAESLLKKTGKEPCKITKLPKPQAESTLKQYIINPSANEELFGAVLFADGQLLLVDAEATTKFTKNDAVSVCFSSAGNQFALGMRSGCIQICGADGVASRSIPLPKSLSPVHVPYHISWLSDSELLVVYWSPELESPVLYCIDMACSYTQLGELYLDFEATYGTNRFYTTFYHNFTSDMQSLVFITSSQQTEAAVVIKTPEGQWYQALLEESFQVVLPFSPNTLIMPRGIALDFTAGEPIPNLYPGLPEMEPGPILYLLNSGGEVQMYHCISKVLALASSNPEPKSDPPSASTPKEPSQPPTVASSDGSEMFQSADGLNSSIEDALSSFSQEVIRFMSSELELPLFLNDEEIPPLSELINLVRPPPSLKRQPTPSLSKKTTKLPDLPSAPYIANTQQFAECRKLSHHLNFTAAVVGVYKERWNKYVSDSGYINTLSADIDALWDQVNDAHQKALAAHNSSIDLLESLKASSNRLAVLEQLFAQRSPIPQVDASSNETDFTYQAIVTGALVNLEAKLASFQNILNVINRQFLSQQTIWAQVLEKPELSSFLSSLQSIYAHTLDLQGRVAFIKGRNSRLDLVYHPQTVNKYQAYLVEAIAASASIPIPTTAVIQANSKVAQQLWLDEFQSAYIRLHSSP